MAGMLMGGLRPSLVRIDQPGDDAGRVELDWTTNALDRTTAVKALLSVLVGALTEQPLHPWTWPITPDTWAPAVRSDARVAQRLCNYLDVDAVGWTYLVHQVKSLATDRHFRRLAVKIAQALKDRGILFRHELDELAASIRAEDR